MEKPKKERKFLKAIGKIAKTLGEELVLGIGRKYIGKVVDKIKIGKRQQMTIIFAFITTLSIASIDSIPYPITGNKQRLGYNTTGNGLVWRGLVSDTVTKPTSYADKNVKAYLVLDSVTGSIYVWKQGAWASLVGGGSFTQPVDSLFFDTSVPTNNVDTAKMRWDYDLGTVVLGMYDQVPNELGFKNFWLVKNQTGSTITKGSLVYASGTVGSSGRISVSKFIANGTIDPIYLLGITAHDLTDGEDGYVISYGKIRQVNTDTFAAGAILYPSPTTAGVWTDVEPVAPNIDLPIGFCVNSSSNNGTIAIRVASGFSLSELHDVAISSPVTNASLYYNGGLWRDTTAALLVSDTASMLGNYALKYYVDSIANNFQDSINDITNGYFKQQFLSVTSDTLLWTRSVQLPTDENLLLAFRNGQILNNTQYETIDTNKIKIAANSYKIGENYTIVYVKGGGGSGSGASSFDTTELNLQARLDLKLNISDTASMLANYALKSYADTSGRFYARQDFENVSSSTLTWTQSDTLVTGGVTVIQVYRNGQILLPSQYTIPTKTTVVIGSTAYKAGENYTVIFPRGGGASGGGGSGSLTSISAGTGITVSPNPITTTGTVSADLSVLMELTDTTLLNLTNRFNNKLNITDTTAMLLPYFRDADTTSLNLTSRFAAKQNTLTLTTTGTSGAATLTGATLNIPQYSGGGGSGTVTSVATGYGLSGGTITTSGTLVLDSATVFTRIRDSIVDVAIGNDTIKILKQEYPAQSSAILNWTVTSKFPIQLKAYILVFRNGQLLNNNQYDITDTAQITLVSTSFKSGANYTIATVSGIGSVSSAQGNPVYPEAGIALSTGTTWTTSITNNSSNWNTAYTDRLKWDGGSTSLVAATGRTSLGGTTVGQSLFTLTNPSAITFPRFNADNSVSALSAANFRSAIGAGTVTSVTAATGTPIGIINNTSTPELSMNAASSSLNGYLTSTDWNTFNGKQNLLTNPITGTGTTNYLPLFNGSTTLTNSSIQESSGNIGIGVTPVSSLQLAAAKSIQLRSGSSGYAKLMFSETGVQSENDIEFGGTLQYNGVDDRLELLTRDNLGGANLTNLGISLARTTGNVTIHKPTTMSSTLSVTGDITEGGNNVLNSLDTVSLSNRINTKQNTITLTTTGTSGAATLVGSTLNIPQYSSGGGTGTVTSVGLSAPSIFNVSGSPVTTSGTLALTYSGNALPLANGGTGATDAANARITLGGTTSGISLFTLTNSVSDKFIKVNSNNTITLLNATDTRTAIGAGTGSVTSVGMTVPTFLSVSGSPVTSSGTLAVSLSGVPLPVLNGGTGGANEADARNNLGAACKSCTETLTGDKTFSGTVTLSSVSGTATSVIGRSSTGQVVGVTVGNGLTLSSGTLSVSGAGTFTTTNADYTVTSTDSYIAFNNNFSNITVTLPTASTNTGRALYFRNVAAGSIISASNNIINNTVTTGTPDNAILSAGNTNYKWCTLVSNGTYWIKMQAN